MKQSKPSHFLLGILFAALAMVGMPLPAQAGIVGSEQLLQSERTTVNREQLQQWMARDDVRQQLQSLGVDAQQATERINALTEQELQQLAQNMEEQPAGSGVIGVIGVVFVVLLILELLGVTNIFTAI
ncbi:PA2779 family protein [Solimonas sp. SE-A11]|uniref:PA2779 family protein n=1 Tax=Solimonas sp. SE-A11 TaxID=3054954 RepID=UPI00259C72E1|nr:PA2779 family protein [Solimonas sp. SE-A11]MDM4772107.1 PA2779 family protein [Solimonas sp. SE-A11]